MGHGYNIELHGSPISPSSQAVHMILDILGLEYTYVEICEKQEEMFTKPILVYGSLVITDHRMAMTYLVSKHMPSMLMYPKQGLYKEVSSCYQKMKEYLENGDDEGEGGQREESLARALKVVDGLVCGGYVTGDRITIADVDLLATFTTLQTREVIMVEKYHSLTEWAGRMRKKIPHFHICCGYRNTSTGTL